MDRGIVLALNQDACSPRSGLMEDTWMCHTCEHHQSIIFKVTVPFSSIWGSSALLISVTLPSCLGAAAVALLCTPLRQKKDSYSAWNGIHLVWDWATAVQKRVVAVVQSMCGSLSSKKLFFVFTKKIHKALFLKYSKGKQKVVFSSW